jgi:DNA-directed RNA polymerase specialized sigma24 family protein
VKGNLPASPLPFPTWALAGECFRFAPAGVRWLIARHPLLDEADAADIATAAAIRQGKALARGALSPDWNGFLRCLGLEWLDWQRRSGPRTRTGRPRPRPIPFGTLDDDPDRFEHPGRSAEDRVVDVDEAAWVLGHAAGPARCLVRLHASGFTNREIAEQVGRSEAWVSIELRRALGVIRDRIEREVTA